MKDMIGMLRRLKASLLGKISSKPGEHIDEKWVEQSRNFCLMPWIHLHVTQAGTATPCCQAPWDEEFAYGNVNKNSIEEIWNADTIGKLRLKMIDDKPDLRCERCYIKEKSGVFSLRKGTNMMYLHHLDRVRQTLQDGSVKNSHPIYFDIRFSNFCNFKCRICGPESSSSWYKEAKEFGYQLKDNQVHNAIFNEPAFFEKLKKYLPYAEEVYFAGGEPMLMHQQYQMLDLLLEAGNTDVLLRYSTNLSGFYYKQKSVLQYWKKFSNVKVYASLDDSGDRGDYQRKGQKWNEIVANRKLLKEECPHVKFFISPTVSILNVFHLPEFHRELIETGFIQLGDLIPSVLEEPYAYNIKALPELKKAEVKAEFEKHMEWLAAQSCENLELKNFVIKEYGHIVSFMLSADLSSYYPEFKKITIRLDELRKESLTSVIPELPD